jgi:uncharacterized membrane protein
MEVEMNEESVTGAAPESVPEFRLLVATFDDPDGAVRALEQVLAARREKQVAALAVASVSKDAQGVVEINEPGDVGAKEGAVAGGLVGGLLGGLFGRKLLAGAAIGAALGALGAEKHDAGIPNPRLREIGAGLPQGSSALVAIAPESGLTGLQSLPGLEDSRMIVESIVLDLDVARQLTEGQYGEALGSLATQAEGLIGEAKARVTELAGTTAKKSGRAEEQGSSGAAGQETSARPERTDLPADLGAEETWDPTRE